MGSSKTKNIVVVQFKRGGDAAVMSRNLIPGCTKRELLKKVEKWWDSNGTNLDDYDGIQAMALKDGEQQ